MKKSVKTKSLALLLIFTMVLASALAACGKKDSGDGGIVLDVSVGPEPETIDPSLNTALMALLISTTFLKTNEIK